MKSARAVRRLVTNSWYVAAPLILLVLIVCGFFFLTALHAFVELAFGAYVADDFLANAMIVIVWTAVIAGVGAMFYALFRLVRWLTGRKKA